MVELAKDIDKLSGQGRVKVVYDDQPVTNLAIVSVVFQNVGNRDVKDQYLNLSLTNGAKILDYGYLLNPKPEMGVTESSKFPLNSSLQQAYDVAYFPPGARWGRYFIVEWAGTGESLDVTLDGSPGSIMLSLI